MDRRTFLRSVVATAASVSFGASFWRAHAGHITPVFDGGPYGLPGAPDARGIGLPPGFSSRLIARSADLVPGTDYVWHFNPDGGATFAIEGGGWIYVSNSELSGRAGGVSAVRFSSDGQIERAYRILSGTSDNCSGGATPWGTWLSCEEVADGKVWECDPTGEQPALVRPALGSFNHEAAVVDPVTNYVYMTEDASDGRFYRFRPDDPIIPLPSEQPVRILESGTLEALKILDPEAAENGTSPVAWLPIIVTHSVHPFDIEVLPTTRSQVPGSTPFARGEGCWFDDVARTAYFSSTSDRRIWAYHAEDDTIEVLFDGAASPASPLAGPDNLTVGPSGDLFVCEDGGDLQMVLITPEGSVTPFVQLSGAMHDGTELAGVAFDPSGTRLYFSSQRAFGAGATYEITGPFRTERVAS